MYFLYEHPDKASSWSLDRVQDVVQKKGVIRTTGDMCQFEMKQEDEQGVAHVKKRTGFMTNCRNIAERLNRRCQNEHRHIELLNGRAKAAQVYPDKLCAEIVKGLIDQMEEDGRISQDRIGAICAEDIEEGIWAVTAEEIDEAEYWNDMTGFKLDSALVKIAKSTPVNNLLNKKKKSYICGTIPLFFLR